MKFGQYENIEEYQYSFPWLDAKLIQFSTGLFGSNTQTYQNDSILLDRRTSKALFTNQCVLDKETLNFFFTNSTLNLNINGQQIEEKNQMVMFGGEDLNAIITGALDLTSLSVPVAVINTYFPNELPRFNEIDGQRIRRVDADTITRDKICSLINVYLQLLRGNDVSRQFVVDMTDNLLFKIMSYLESFEISLIDNKQRLSTQEINRVLDFISHTDVFSLQELQAICMCSPRTLNNLINLHFGCSPNKLLSVVRLNKINSYLHEKSSHKKTIKHICEKFGVYSRYRLAKDYQNLFGKSIKDNIKKIGLEYT